MEYLRSLFGAEPATRSVPLFKVFMAPEVDAAVLETLHSGYITQGKKVEAFEEALRAWFSHPHVLTVNSGTSALHLAFRLMQNADEATAWPGLAAGDEVLTSPLTCTATNWPALANGVNLKWVDVDPRSGNICLDDLERKLSPTTKVIMFVHWGGVPVDLARVDAICDTCRDRYGFRPKVIEDAAHAFGAEYGGLRVGARPGHYACFSLQAIKHVTSVDGGLLCVPDEATYARGKLLRWYGIDRSKRASPNSKKDFRMENPVEEWGYKFHMNDVSASIGLANFAHADWILARCRDNAAFYDDALRGLGPNVELCDVPAAARPAYWLYSIKVRRKLDFMAFMNANGVMVSQVHARNDKHPCVAAFANPHLPRLDDLEERLVCIPVGWWVDPKDRAYVVAKIKAFFAE